MNSTRLGALIRQRRLELNVSQSTLADRVGVDQRRISRIENASAAAPIPSGEELNAIAEALEIPVAVLLREAGYEVNPSTEEQQDVVEGFWARRTADLSSEQRRILIELAEQFSNQNREGNTSS